ncbi:MAG: SemiSWEET transporter [Magnetococcales bacterium]|nr:SemiSWEET transporter [Magnetococcales bacterium]
MIPTSLLGFAAAFLTTFALVPQALRILRTRDTRAISLGMYVMSSLGAFLWVLYGWILNAWPIVIANSIAFLLLLFILMMKIRLESRLREKSLSIPVPPFLKKR